MYRWPVPQHHFRHPYPSWPQHPHVLAFPLREPSMDQIQVSAGMAAREAERAMQGLGLSAYRLVDMADRRTSIFRGPVRIAYKVYGMGLNAVTPSMYLSGPDVPVEPVRVYGASVWEFRGRLAGTFTHGCVMLPWTAVRRALGRDYDPRWIATWRADALPKGPMSSTVK